MEAQIPLYLENHLMDLGVMSSKHEELDDPVSDSLREYRFSMPEVDENWEPDF